MFKSSDESLQQKNNSKLNQIYNNNRKANRLDDIISKFYLINYSNLRIFYFDADYKEMFKQHNNTHSNLYTMNSTNGTSHQTSSKQVQIQNFSKLLKKLQTENVNIDELRLLKTQHAYLQKLRNQRQKIEQLKLKYTQCEQNMHKYQQENKSQSSLLQQYQGIIEMLKEELQNQREQRVQLESSISNKYEVEREKMRFKMSQLNKEVQDLKKQVKNKDLLIMQLEQENQEKIKEVKDQFMDAKKKLVAQIEERLKSELEEKSQFQNQLVQLRNLVTRQNKALKQQNQKYEEISESHNKLVDQLQRCHEQITNLTLACEEYDQKMQSLEITNQNLVNSLNQIQSNAQNQGQLQDLRKRMAEMAKGQIQRIEFIVNEFQ